MSQSERKRSRIVIDAASDKYGRGSRHVSAAPRTAEVWVAISIIAAAAIATFFALFLTSRPYDPMNATVAPQEVVPQGPTFTPSPKPSPTTTASPQTSPATAPPSEPAGATSLANDDATIQSQIEKALASDPLLAKLDVSTLVENGRVTIVGSVRSADLKQRVERTIRSVKGVSGVDNQLVITEATP